MDWHQTDGVLGHKWLRETGDPLINWICASASFSNVCLATALGLERPWDRTDPACFPAENMGGPEVVGDLPRPHSSSEREPSLEPAQVC